MWEGLFEDMFICRSALIAVALLAALAIGASAKDKNSDKTYETPEMFQEV